MATIPFEWDEAKGAENDAKHGVSFETATEVFSDPFAVERLDDREDYGEDRFILIGFAEGTVLTVVYTERDGRIRQAGCSPLFSKLGFSVQDGRNLAAAPRGHMRQNPARQALATAEGVW